METILNKNEKPVIDELVEFLKSLTEKEQQKINYFIQGIKFMKEVEKKESE
jgi:hypothetical protein